MQPNNEPTLQWWSATDLCSRLENRHILFLFLLFTGNIPEDIVEDIKGGLDWLLSKKKSPYCISPKQQQKKSVFIQKYSHVGPQRIKLLTFNSINFAT